MGQPMSLCVRGRNADQLGELAQDGAGGRGALRVGRRLRPPRIGSFRLGPRAWHPVARLLQLNPRACPSQHMPGRAQGRRPEQLRQPGVRARSPAAHTRQRPTLGAWAAQPADLSGRAAAPPQSTGVLGPCMRALQPPLLHTIPPCVEWAQGRLMRVSAICPHQHYGLALCIPVLGAPAHGLAQRRDVWAGAGAEGLPSAEPGA